MIPDLLQWYVNVSNLQLCCLYGFNNMIYPSSTQDTIRPTHKIPSFLIIFLIFFSCIFVLIDSRHIVETSTYKAYKCMYAETKRQQSKF